MNDTFSFGRFGLIFKKTVLEKQAQLLGLIGLILVADLLLYFVGTSIGMVWDAVQELTFILGFVAGGSFVAAFVFNYFSSNASGSSYLTLPASTFEKWLCGALIAGVLFTLIFLVFYRVVDTTFVERYHKSLNPKNPFYKEMYEHVNVFRYDGFVAQKTYLMFVNFTGAMLVGSLYFNKLSFIKVALLICGLIIGAHFINYAMAKMVFDNVDRALPYYCVFIPVNDQFGKVFLPDYASKAVDLCTFFIVPAILWMVSYIRLREKEL